MGTYYPSTRGRAEHLNASEIAYVRAWYGWASTLVISQCLNCTQRTVERVVARENIKPKAFPCPDRADIRQDLANGLAVAVISSNRTALSTLMR